MRHVPDRYTPVRLTGPTSQPVTLDEARAYCRSEASDDAIVAGLIGAAVEALDGPEGTLGRCLMPQVWRQPFGGFRDCLALPFPAIDVVEVSYLDETGATQVVDPATYRLEDAAGLPYVVYAGERDWPATFRADRATVFVTFTAGFGDGVPAPIRSAILLDVRRAYGAIKADASLRKEVVEGVGSQEWDVGSLDNTIGDIITRLLAPYRRINL